MYYKLICKSAGINSKVREFKNVSIVSYLVSRIANIFIPIFLILKIKPNIITLINVLLSFVTIVLVNVLGGKFFGHALICYFFCKILDGVDGGVARIIKRKTFFGKFLDSMNDAFVDSLFFLSLSFYCFNLTGNYTLLILGTITPIANLMDVLILDKFSALVRWSNVQNKKNFPSYIRKDKLLRFFLTIYDINFLLIYTLFIFKGDIAAIQLLFGCICFLIYLSAVTNLIMHSFYAYRYLNFNKE